MGLRNQLTSTLSFTRTQFGLQATVVLPNGHEMETMFWDSKKDVVNNAVSICKANKAFGRLVLSPGTLQQEVIKI